MSLKVVKDQTRNALKALESLNKSRVLIGIPSEENNREDGEPIGNAQLGYIQENGSPARNIPARPFLVPGVAKAETDCANILGKYAKVAFKDPKAIEKGLTAAGILAVNSVKATIKSGEGFAPLAPSTLAARRRAGFSGTKPLIRTGQLLNSINFVVREK